MPNNKRITTGSTIIGITKGINSLITLNQKISVNEPYDEIPQEALKDVQNTIQKIITDITTPMDNLEVLKEMILVVEASKDVLPVQ